MVLLSGDLGAGKTVLAQGIAAGLGVTDPVTSPTFTLVRPLPCGPGPATRRARAVRTMLHADLYRLDHRREVVDLGLGELVEDEAVAVVEWGEAAEAPRSGATTSWLSGSSRPGAEPTEARPLTLQAWSGAGLASGRRRVRWSRGWPVGAGRRRRGPGR